MKLASHGDTMMHTRWAHSMAGEEYARIYSWGNNPDRKVCSLSLCFVPTLFNKDGRVNTKVPRHAGTSTSHKPSWNQSYCDTRPSTASNAGWTPNSSPSKNTQQQTPSSPQSKTRSQAKTTESARNICSEPMAPEV